MAQCETTASPIGTDIDSPFPEISFRCRRKLRTRHRPTTRPHLRVVHGQRQVGCLRMVEPARHRFGGLRLGIDPARAIVTSLTTALIATAVVLAVLVIASAASPQFGRAIDLGAMLPLGISAVTLGLRPHHLRCASRRLAGIVTHGSPRSRTHCSPICHSASHWALSTLNRQQVDAASTLGLTR